MVAELGRNIFKLFQVHYSMFYSVLYVAQTTTDYSTYSKCKIHAVDSICVALGERCVSAYECRRGNMSTSTIVIINKFVYFSPCF